MKDYENSNIKCILTELNRIIRHAEKAVQNVGENNNQRLEEINFEQLTRESESKINVFQREVDALANIEAMKMAAEDMNRILQRFYKFDKEILIEYQNKLRIEENKLAEIKKDYYDSKMSRMYLKDPSSPNSTIEQILDFLHFGTTEIEKKHCKKQIHTISQSITRFEQITNEFRSAFRKLSEIHKMLLDKIYQVTVFNIENQTIEENLKRTPSSNKGRKKEPWWGGKWENLHEHEVEQRLKQTYDETNSLLSDLKEEKNIDIDKCRNAVWAAVYFYAAEKEGLVNPNKSANSISFIGDENNHRGLYNIGVYCNKGTVHNYYKIIKGFLRATIDTDSNSPKINQFIHQISDEKNTDEYPSTREWLRSNKNLIVVNNELGDKVNSSEDIVMFVAKNLQILRRIFYKVQLYFK